MWGPRGTKLLLIHLGTHWIAVKCHSSFSRNWNVANIQTKDKSASQREVTSVFSHRIISGLPVPQDVLTECTLYSVSRQGVEEPGLSKALSSDCCSIWPSVYGFRFHVLQMILQMNNVNLIHDDWGQSIFPYGFLNSNNVKIRVGWWVRR